MRRPSRLLRALLVAAVAASGLLADVAAGWAEDEPAGGRLRRWLAERRGERATTADGDRVVRLVHDDLARDYLVHLPVGADGPGARPLVVALHGGGGDAALMARDDLYGLRRAADRHGFVVVFPNGTGPRGSGRPATWNAGACCGHARDRNVDDVGFLRAVIADVARRHPIDPARVFVVGMSNGGMMAHRMACEAADVVRAVMAVAGTDNTRSCAPSRPVAVLHVHARDDDRVLFDGGAGAAFRDPGKVTDFRSVADTIAAWVRRDRAEPTAKRVLARPGAVCDRHAARPGGAPVQLCVTETGGHGWPGGGRLLGGAPSRAIDADEVMWDFFSSL